MGDGGDGTLVNTEVESKKIDPGKGVVMAGCSEVAHGGRS